MDLDIIINNITRLCDNKGVPPTTACKESGAGQNFIVNLKKGVLPSIEKVAIFAQYLGVTTSELLGEKIPPVSKLDTSDTLLASCDEETKTIINLLNQLDPENLKKAQDHLDYLLAKQAEQEGKK